MEKKTVLLIIFILIFCVFFSSCRQWNREDRVLEPKTGIFYRVDGHEDIIYTIERKNLSDSQYIMVSSLQGIVAQTVSSIFIINDLEDELWLNECKETYNIETIETKSPWELVTLFRSCIGENSYVLYNLIGEEGVSYSDQTINYATTISGATQALMVSKELEQDAIEHGLILSIDTTDGTWNTQRVFNNYKNKLNNTYLIHQDPERLDLRDYSIAGKAMCFYSDYYDGSENIKEEIYNWSTTNAPVFGWTKNEVNFVSANSLLSKITIAADWSTNLSFYSSLERENSIKQINHQKDEIQAENGKHYVAIVMSDGDNVQWMINSFATSKLFYGSQYRGEFKLTWTTSPALYDVAPNILKYLYQNENSNDYFIAGPSGAGYCNPSEYNPASIAEYAAYTAGYMEKMDTSVLNIIDNYVGNEQYDFFAKYDSIKGGIVSVGNYYLEGNGGVYFTNDKPFITVRETLWRSEADENHNRYYGFIERVAQRINSYSTDPSSIEGYTVVLAHAWSVGTMEYLSRFVELLDDHIVLVTADELIDLVTLNVKHENIEELDDYLPIDFENNLAPISTEQYRIIDFNNTPVNVSRKFMFEEDNPSGWFFNCGGLQYDFSGFKLGKVTLDGSDLDDRIDAFPNSWMYTKFDLNSNDLILQLKVNSGDNADTNFRVRFITFENNKLVYHTLHAEEYDKDLDAYGYYLLNESSPSVFTYEISDFVNQTVLLSIEQDDSGEGSGEIVNVNKIFITDFIETVSTKTFWSSDEIMDEWLGRGKVVKHPEGLCLERNTSDASISCTVKLDNEVNYLKLYIRKFIRPTGPQDLDAKIVLKINDEIVRSDDSNNDYVLVTEDNFVLYQYNISSFRDQTITIEIINIEGEHACFNTIVIE
ncbi:MAG: GxGYxYP domain-containing protein [Candidatus Izemoplasmatales bacterium]|jgi:hypothetical protein